MVDSLLMLSSALILKAFQNVNCEKIKEIIHNVFCFSKIREIVRNLRLL